MSGLSPQQRALATYLESLLGDAGPDVPVPSAPVPAPAAATPPRPVAAVPRKPGLPNPPYPWPGARPPWAATAFEVRCFVVGGVKFALPTALLAGGSAAALTPSPVAGAARWHLGLVQQAAGPVEVAHAASLLLPPGRATAPGAGAAALFLADGEWALAVDALAETVTLDPESVRWRTDKTKRRWLAGMAATPGCALLDPDQLTYLLALCRAPSADWAVIWHG